MTSTISRVGALLALCTAPLFAHADILAVTFDGSVYDVNSSSAAATQIAPSGPSFNSLATDRTIFWSVETFGEQLYTIDPATGAATPGPAVVPSLDVRGLAHFAGSLFAIQNANPDNLWRINPATGAAILVGSTGVSSLQALAADSSGQLYGWDLGFGLMTISSTTGLATDVSASAGGGDIQGLAFSPLGLLYGARDELYTIDTSTGIRTLVGAITGTPDIRGIEFTTQAIPEPATLALLGIALAGLGFSRRKARR